MALKILDGKALAEKIYAEISETVREKYAQNPPKLVVILVGEDPASRVYVGNKEKSCVKAGILSQSIRFPATVSEDEVLKTIAQLNADKSVTGIIVQLPLPAHIAPEKVIMAIDPQKDVDGFHPVNLGNVYLSKETEFLPPATPAGIIMLLEKNGVEIAGKNAVVVGRSNNVGKAVAIMLLNRNATVTVCHSKTANMADFTQKADILVVATGKKKMVTGGMVKDGAVVIDVGIHRNDDGMLCGDTDFETVSQKASFITPVPGGVGPMTVASLITNTLRAYERSEFE
ncbi:MAG: bifunctional methylenetetrahydrofolate dehydrogenase/methenyltetrahydrofolate cyclohydrolase FolD [Candidatus Peregrinibacteria bacterium]